MTIFHLYFNRTLLIESAFQYLLKSLYNVHTGQTEIRPYHRRVMQLLVRPNLFAKSCFNLAIMKKNFRSFDILLKLTHSVDDVPVSRHFMEDFGYMLSSESSTI